MFTDVKSIFATKTFWGGLIAVVPAIFGMLGYTITGDEITSIANHGQVVISEAITVFGAVVAIWGRLTATKKAVVSKAPTQ